MDNNETTKALKKDLALLRWFEIASVGSLALFEVYEVSGLKDMDVVIGVGSVIIFGGIIFALKESVKLLKTINEIEKRRSKRWR